MTGTPRFLVVDDERQIRRAVAHVLEPLNGTVSEAATGREALTLAAAESPALVVLDLGLPDMDGVEVCRRLRASSEVPVIVISARGEEVDRVVLLEMGADDYLVKPFGVRELVARIRAVARRSGGSGDSAAEPATRSFGQLVIDIAGHRVTVEGVDVELTPKEFALIEHLSAAPGAAHRRRDILESVWDAHWYGPTKTLDAHMAALRRKLGHGEWIETVRGVGYRFVPPA